MLDDFYTTLPSNSSMSYYPKNTLTNFTTQLPSTICLSGSWEVGLVEIQYPHNWYNVSDENNELIVHMRDSSMRIPLPTGYYNFVNHLIATIQTSVRKVRKQMGYNNVVSIQYSPVRRVIDVNLGAQKDNMIIEITPQLQHMLGLPTNILRHGNTSGKAQIDLDPIHTLYVYCDIIESRVVGDKMAQLLRVVPVTGEDSKIMSHNYENIHYIPLLRKEFSSIEIDIRDNRGKPVPFESGTLNVTLHFRRRKKVL